MNLVGKIFIVLILIASTVFMTMGIMVYSTQHNWREAITGEGKNGEPVGLKMQLTKARDVEAKLKLDIQANETAFAIEKTAHAQALAKVQTASENYAKTNADSQAKLAELSSNLEKATNTVQVTQENLSAIRKEDTALRDDIRLANKATDEQLKKAQAMEDRLHIATGQLKDLQARNEQLAGDVAKARLLLSTVGLKIDSPVNMQPPTVRGEVLAVDKQNNAEISLGSDDGLIVGNTLEIYRGDRYLGRMQVLEVQPHRAVGKVLKELQRDVIHTGDQVATRLKA